MAESAARTKYRQTKLAVIRWIEEQGLQPGDRLPPVRKLMTIHGVSYATITRALSELREAGIIDQQWGKGIFVRQRGTSLRNLAVTLNDINTPQHPQIERIIRGIGSELAATDWRLQTFMLPGGAIFGQADEPLLAALLRERRIDAVLALSPHPPQDMDQLHALSIPVVAVENEFPQTGTASVTPSILQSAALLAEHLCDRLGHRRINLVLGPKHPYSARLQRFSAAFGQAMLSELRGRRLRRPESALLYCNYRWDDAKETIGRWLTGSERPTAIVLSDDEMAMQTVVLARSLGLSVPKDLSVVTSALVRSDSGSITGLLVPWEELGKRAVQLLRRIAAGESPTVERVSVELKVGESSSSAPRQ